MHFAQHDLTVFATRVGKPTVSLCSIQQMRDIIKREWHQHAFLSLLRVAPCQESSAAPSSPAQKEQKHESQWAALCSEYSDVFGDPPSVPERTVTHKIVLENPDLPPPKPRQYRMSESELREVRT